jgi:hypothetical protein
MPPGQRFARYRNLASQDLTLAGSEQEIWSEEEIFNSSKHTPALKQFSRWSLDLPHLVIQREEYCFVFWVRELKTEKDPSLFPLTFR